MNVIFDMDETLISHDKNDSIFPRPHLNIFLRYCFETFETVSIWTNAEKGWFEKANQEVFIPILKEINEECGTDHDFYFVYTRERSSMKRVKTNHFYDGGSYRVKRLKKIWRKKQTPHTRYNTIIVDDNDETYEDNYGNAIPIKAWHHTSSFDTELLKLAQYFGILIKQIESGDNVLYIEKRWWRKKMKS